MQSLAFFKSVTADKSNLLDRLLKLLAENGIRYCVINGLAAAAYVEPLVSLDFDMVVASYQLGRFESLLASTFIVRRGARQIEITLQGSDLRVNVYTDPRYADFVERAQTRPILGMNLPAATVEDVLKGTIWNAQDPQRSAVLRQRDLVDLNRLVSRYPRLLERVPAALRQRLVTDGA